MGLNLETITIDTGTERLVMGPYTPPADILLMRHIGLDGLHSQRWEETTPLAVGVTDTGRKVQARTATIQVGLAADTNPELEALRRRMTAVLAPTGQLFTVSVTGLDLQTRISHASCNRPPLLDSSRRLQTVMDTRFQLRFPDPLFYGPQQYSVTVQGAAAAPAGFTIPFPIPFDIGGLSWGGQQTITYEGTWPATPDVRVTGPISDFSIINSTTGGFVRFSATYSLPAGVIWHFRPNAARTFELEAVDGTLSNGIHTIDTESNITDWPLQRGSNTIVMAGSAQKASTTVVMSWTDAFVGI